jgi:hypothetical protein
MISILALALSAGAQAQPRPDVVTNGNAWSITFYDDSAPAHTQWATQNLCFVSTGMVGTQLSGYWYSTTFFDWNGNWRQEGDQVFMTGDYAGDTSGNAVGHDGMEWQLVTAEKAAEGFGHWKEWREDGGTGNAIGFGNAKFKRIGSCTFQPPGGVDYATLERLVIEESSKAPKRYRKDGKEALGPLDKEIVPIQ